MPLPPPRPRWRYVPWDLDGTLGQTYATERTDPLALRPYEQENLLFARLLEDPEVAARVRHRVAELARTELPLEEVLGLIDQLAAEIAQAAHRDEARWGEAYRQAQPWGHRTDLTSHDEELVYLRAWVRSRWELLSHQPW